MLMVGVEREDVLASLAAGVVVVDAGGALSYANPAALRILRRDELVGRSVEQVLCGAEALARAMDSVDGRGEADVVRGDGTHTAIGFSVSAAPSRGAKTVLFQEIGGVLELRRERDRLLQMAALGDALPSILHELRNPLAAVTSVLELLVEEAPEATRRDLHSVLWEVRRMSLTLQGVGGFVRPMHVERHVSVDLAVSEACRVLEATAASRGIVLEERVAAMPLLPLDWGVVSGIVFNLVKNAIDACSEGCSILVEAMLDSDEVFVLRVTDSGSGMSPEVLSRCRELFFTSKEKGSGIGLALCQRLAESAGGRLDITSAPTLGTIVTLSVPLHPPELVPSIRRSPCPE
jgi:signal transduction histidine kinase